MRQFFNRLFGGGNSEHQKPPAPEARKPLPQERTTDLHDDLFARNASLTMDRGRTVEKNSFEEMRVKKGTLIDMLRKLVPDQKWGEREVSLAMDSSEIARLPKIERSDKQALQEIADAIALRIRQERLKESETEVAV